jgi:hypothetical protein
MKNKKIIDETVDSYIIERNRLIDEHESKLHDLFLRFLQKLNSNVDGEFPNFDNPYDDPIPCQQERTLDKTLQTEERTEESNNGLPKYLTNPYNPPCCDYFDENLPKNVRRT